MNSMGCTPPPKGDAMVPPVLRFPFTCAVQNCLVAFCAGRSVCNKRCVGVSVHLKQSNGLPKGLMKGLQASCFKPKETHLLTPHHSMYISEELPLACFVVTRDNVLRLWPDLFAKNYCMGVLPSAG